MLIEPPVPGCHCSACLKARRRQAWFSDLYWELLYFLILIPLIILHLTLAGYLIISDYPY